MMLLVGVLVLCYWFYWMRETTLRIIKIAMATDTEIAEVRDDITAVKNRLAVIYQLATEEVQQSIEEGWNDQR